MSQATVDRARAGSKELYLAAVDRIGDRNAAPAWLARIRNSAAEAFRRMPFPTTHDEDWKYTNLAPILGTPFETAVDGPVQLPSIDEIDQAAPFNQLASRLVFVDGHFAPSLSTKSAARVLTTSLESAVAELPSLVEAHLARHADIRESAFTALNTASLFDGAILHIPSGVVLEDPVVIVFLTSDREVPTASHPRLLAVLGENSSAAIVEIHAGLGRRERFVNSVVEINLEQSADLKHVQIVTAAGARYVGTTEAQLGRDSSYDSLVVAIGADLARNDLHVRMDGEGASCTLNGVSVTRDRQHVDNHTLIEHSQPHGTSRQLYKSILDGSSRTVFNGKIVVRPGAEKTDAQQSNKSLLLSADATLDTKPQLEILADDVRCTHGATVGQLDDEMIFYLRSRGLDEEAAHGILTYAFATDVLESVRDTAIRGRIERLLAKQLAGSAADGLGEPWEVLRV